MVEHKMFLKKSYKSNFVKMQNRSTHTDGWVDILKLLVAFHNFTNVPNDENLG
jgi:hypothetical protein